MTSALISPYHIERKLTSVFLNDEFPFIASSRRQLRVKRISVIIETIPVRRRHTISASHAPCWLLSQSKKRSGGNEWHSNAQRRLFPRLCLDVWQSEIRLLPQWSPVFENFIAKTCEAGLSSVAYCIEKWTQQGPKSILVRTAVPINHWMLRNLCRQLSRYHKWYDNWGTKINGQA
jgi:hypothetical protein